MFAGMLWAGENRDPPGLRQPFLQQLNSLADKFKRQITHPSKVAARTGKTFNQFAVDRIAAEAEHDRNCQLQPLYREDHQLLRDNEFGTRRRDFAGHDIHVVATSAVKTNAEILT